MVKKTFLRITLAGLLGAFAAVVTSAQAPDSDDVAAAARKARAQQKTAPKPTKVVTNDDMPSKPVEPETKPSTPAAVGQEGATAQGAQSDKEEDDPKKEAYWHKKYTGIHDKLTQAEKDLSVMQRELNNDQMQYYSDPQKALVEQHNRTAINDKTAKVAEKQKEVDSLKQQLSDLDDECRKSGCNPGWVR